MTKPSKAPAVRKRAASVALESAGGTLESAVLAMLVRADSAMEIAPFPDAHQKAMKLGPPGTLNLFKRKRRLVSSAFGGVVTDPQKLAALQLYSKKLYLGLAQQGLIDSTTIRFRRKSKGFDRKFVVESSIDPLDGTSVLLRVRPISDAKIPAAAALPRMLTTQQAAAELNVSRPYVVELVKSGSLKGVEVTGGGHRRIPAEEVQRVRKDMQSAMHKGNAAISKLTEGASKRELEDATKNATRSWVART